MITNITELKKEIEKIERQISGMEKTINAHYKSGLRIESLTPNGNCEVMFKIEYDLLIESIKGLLAFKKARLEKLKETEATLEKVLTGLLAAPMESI